jgi:hypothetical protein
MRMSELYTIPIGVVAALLVLLVVGALEVGRRLSRVVPVGDRQFSSISALILALVGLLLAFSFALAAERYAVRRAATVQEANAIGTFWLRTALLPEPVRSEMRTRVRRYLDLHFEHREARIDQARLAKTEADAQRLQRELWSLLTEESRRTPDALSLLLVTPALNTMIDDEASVLAANENRLPDALLMVLLLLVVFASLVIGYGSHAEKRNLALWGALVIVLGGTLVVLIDMDRPRYGLIRASVAPYVRLRESLQSDSPPR